MRGNSELKTNNLNNMNSTAKVNFIKNLLFNSELTEALNILLIQEKKDLKIIKLILKIFEDEIIKERIKEQSTIKTEEGTKNYLYSKILSILHFNNKKVILSSFFKLLSKEELKSLAYHEYQNKTNVSINSDIFHKYCHKYEEEALVALKLDEEEILMLTMEMQKYNFLFNEFEEKKKKRRRKKLIRNLFIIIFVTLFSSLVYVIHVENNKVLSKYNGLIYPGIYINNINLEKVSINDLENILKREQKRIEEGTIIITNANGNYEFTYEQLGMQVDYQKILTEIKDYNKNLGRLQKLLMIKSNRRYKTFYLSGNFNDGIDSFIKLLKEKLNKEPKGDGLIIDSDYNVHYDKGNKGFVLDEAKTKAVIEKALINITDESVIEVYGDVIENEIKYEALANINKKVSSYTTVFNNAGNRGKNITIASSRLNGTILMPGDEFSYLKVVGPYGTSNGYLPAPVYISGKSAVANGGGVCQLASTLYNAQLRAGLQTIYRTNHTYAPTYVPPGLDATVYSTTTDYKFKNQYEHPIYIVSYIKGDYLTVDIWSVSDLLGGRTYEPYSVYSSGSYLSYLKEYENGILINEKYLDKSFYRKK